MEAERKSSRDKTLRRLLASRDIPRGSAAGRALTTTHHRRRTRAVLGDRGKCRRAAHPHAQKHGRVAGETDLLVRRAVASRKWGLSWAEIIAQKHHRYSMMRFR